MTGHRPSLKLILGVLGVDDLTIALFMLNMWDRWFVEGAEGSVMMGGNLGPI